MTTIRQADLVESVAAALQYISYYSLNKSSIKINWLQDTSPCRPKIGPKVGRKNELVDRALRGMRARVFGHISVIAY